MLSVGAICFEDRFCASRKGGTGGSGRGIALGDSAWRLLWLGIKKAWSVLDGPFFCFLVQMSVENCPFTLLGTPCLAFLGSFQSGGAFSSRRALTIEHFVMSGCGQGHEPARNF